MTELSQNFEEAQSIGLTDLTVAVSDERMSCCLVR